MMPCKKLKKTKYSVLACGRNLSTMNIKQPNETEGFCVFKTLYDGYLKNGDTEKFYGKYYSQVPLESTTFFRGLSRNAATL